MYVVMPIYICKTQAGELRRLTGCLIRHRMNQHDDLAIKWIAFHLHSKDEDMWAFEELLELVQNKPREAWKVINTIFSISSSVNVRKNLAAGPMEDLLSCHGHSFIDELEVRCRQDPHYARMIKSVWSGEMPGDIQARVKEMQARYGNAV